MSTFLLALSITINFVATIIVLVYVAAIIIKRFKKLPAEYIYLGGPISGENIPECKIKFAQAKAKLKQLGYNVITPFDVVPEHLAIDPKKWGRCMIFCFEAIEPTKCTEVIMLEGWPYSWGARMEWQYAERLEKKITMYNSIIN